jgi:dipeptidyl aminopeptidase/acylaminoacyl peptidase
VRGDSLELYRALEHYGVETELVIYPGAGHLSHQEKHQIDILERMLAWFDRYLK